MMQVEIPQYLTLEHYKRLNQITSTDVRENTIDVISAITGQDKDTVKTWSLKSVVQVYNELNDVLKNMNPSFYPVIEWNGVEYGYAPMSKMSVGEYIDLDQLMKEPIKNMEQIMAVLYRPITQNNTNTATFMLKSTIKALKYDVENIFDHYDIEQYDTAKRKQVAEEYKQFPAEIGLGALTFFTSINMGLLADLAISSQNKTKQEMEKKKRSLKQQWQNIMGGYILSMKLQKRPSYK